MTSTTVQLLSGLRNMSIKVYPTEVEAVDEDSKSRVFVIKLETPDVFSISIDTLICKAGLDELFYSIRKAVEIMEIEK